MPSRDLVLKILAIGFAVGVVSFLVVQVVPYGRKHSNPTVTAEPAWDSPDTRALFMTACGDCHSNETVWPWYSNIAPVSWLIQRDVEQGRDRLNVSEWGSGRNSGRESAEKVQEGSMPPSYYKLLHPSADLSSSDKSRLIAGLQSTFGAGRQEREGAVDGPEDDKD